MIKTGMYSYDDRLQKIYAFNLSYLLHAQHLIRQDPGTAGFYLGIDEELLDLLKTLPLPDLLKMASIDRLICQLRFEKESVMNVITRDSRLEALQGIHAAIVLSTDLINEIQNDEITSNSMTKSVSQQHFDQESMSYDFFNVFNPGVAELNIHKGFLAG